MKITRLIFKRGMIALILCVSLFLTSCNELSARFGDIFPAPGDEFSISGEKKRASERNTISTEEEEPTIEKQRRQIEALQKRWKFIELAADVYQDDSIMENLKNLKHLGYASMISTIAGSVVLSFYTRDFFNLFKAVNTDQCKNIVILHSAVAYAELSKIYAKELETIVKKHIDNESELDYDTAEKIIDLYYNIYYYYGKATVYTNILQEYYFAKYGDSIKTTFLAVGADLLGINTELIIPDLASIGYGIATKYTKITIEGNQFKFTWLGQNLANIASSAFTVFDWVDFFSNKKSEFYELDKAAEDNFYVNALVVTMQKIWNEA
ncbi:MAG: hypothetical protein LBS21_12640 [Clostridiales bacterium]|jgi:hypothetical protein|nr:hypothetical protein [Clostridiales bacterium]